MKKKHPFHSFLQNLLSQFSKCWANFATYAVRGDTGIAHTHTPFFRSAPPQESLTVVVEVAPYTSPCILEQEPRCTILLHHLPKCKPSLVDILCAACKVDKEIEGKFSLKLTLKSSFVGSCCPAN